MTWFGTVSAWGAVVVGLVFAAYASFSFPAWSSWLVVLAAVLLFMSAYRTLRKMSGGLRLLAGAWGLAAGLSANFVQGLALSGGPDEAAVLLIALVPIASFAGLFLTVTHKETK